MRAIRVSTVRLTTYHSGTTSAERSTAAMQEIVDGVAAGRYRANLQRLFRFDEIVEAHRFMEENRGSGKGCPCQFPAECRHLRNHLPCSPDYFSPPHRISRPGRDDT